MGDFVPNIAPEPFDWGQEQSNGTNSYTTFELVRDKFNATMTTAEEMLLALMGTDGNSGYLGNLQNSIQAADIPSISDFAVTVPSINIQTESRPSPSLGDLDLDFPDFTEETPVLAPLPTVDISGLTPGVQPDAVSPTIDWTEIIHDETLYAELLSNLISVLQNGATGLDPIVEAEIIARAQARQDIIDDKQEQETLEFFSSRGFDLPTGVMAAAMAELANERARNRTDLNGKTLIEQAELAQKNSQFALQLAKDLDVVLRDHTTRRNDNTLDYAKSVALNIISVYSENVKAYLAGEQAKLENVRTQVEYLRGVVEANKGLVTMFSAQAEVYSTIIDGKSKRNASVTEIFKAENIGYEAETRAITAAGQLTVEEYKLRVESADLQLRRAIAEVDAVVKTYGTEQGLREKVAEAMANIAMQLAASSYGAVNASAGLSYNGSKSESESFNHGESRSVSYGFGESLNESHNYEEEAL